MKGTQEWIILPNDIYGGLSNYSPWATSFPWHTFVRLQAENGFSIFKWLKKNQKNDISWHMKIMTSKC